MKKERYNQSSNNQKAESSRSRKQLRKQKKVDKKQKKRHYFDAKANHQPHINKISTKPKQAKSLASNKNRLNTQTQKHDNRNVSVEKRNKVPKPEKTGKVSKRNQDQTEDDKMIQLCEQKLGMSSGKDKYKKIAKNFNFDDDIFDFLEGISKKVEKGYDYKNKKVQDEVEEVDIESEGQHDFQDQEQEGADVDEGQGEGEDEEEDQFEEQQEVEGEAQSQDFLVEGEGEDPHEEQIGQSPNEEDFDEQFDQMFDNLDQFDGDFQERDDQMIQEEQIQQPKAKKTKAQGRSKLKLKPVQGLQAEKLADSQAQQIRKSMNRLLNKLSDGNILFTFRQFLKIIESYPKSATIPVYAETFTKFNLMIEKPLFHILATNVALLVSLHYAIGNRLMAPALYHLVHKYLEVYSEEENMAELKQIGYSKKFERLKNFATMVGVMYNYKSVSGQFIESYVNWLTKSLNKNNIELIYIIIQKSGIKIRQNDPSTLKTIINTIKTAIESYKLKCNNDEEQMQKIKFIEMELNEVRFNKKEQTSTDQRMAFLETFINKNVMKEIQKEKQIFPLTFQALITADTSRTIWWEHQISDDVFNSQEEGEIADQLNIELSKEKRQLLQLAKSFRLVTQTKKNIFLCLMDSKDYLQATQRILELNVKHQQDIATVLVEVCTLEPNFNPYYPLVAAKIAGLVPKFRLNLQYAIWDRLKLLETYELRRTSNLAKFTAKLVSDPTSNCSLSLLKFYPDLSNVKAIDATFLNICFTFFFKKVKKDYISRLVGKLREQNNRDIKYGIQEYLVDFECPEALKDKVRVCRRLLRIEMDERKMETGDDY